MRNVQTQAQTRASVSPYADYKDGLIVLTGRGVAVAATTVHSHSVSPASEAGQIYSSCSSGEQNRPSPGELKCHLQSL